MHLRSPRSSLRPPHSPPKPDLVYLGIFITAGCHRDPARGLLADSCGALSVFVNVAGIRSDAL